MPSCAARALQNEPPIRAHQRFQCGTHQVDELEDGVRERRRPFLERLKQLLGVDVPVSRDVDGVKLRLEPPELCIREAEAFRGVLRLSQ